MAGKLLASGHAYESFSTNEEVDARRRAARLALAPRTAEVLPPAAPALVDRGVSVTYGRHTALREVDLTVGRGHVTALMGR